MTNDERERMSILVSRIQDEKDPRVFDDLVRELNELIGAKSGRIHSEQKQTDQ
jgi:hypothetical protein